MDVEVLSRTAQLQRVLETISGGLLVVESDDRISLCNGEFEQHFGVPTGAGDWIGTQLDTAVDTLAAQMADPDQFRRRSAELVGSVQTAFEHVHTADGRTFERDYLPMLDELGGYSGHVWHYWDISDRRAAELDRERRLRAELIAQRLGVHAQRTRAAEAERTGHDLAERNKELLETDLLRKELLATASHELRTPLTTILNFAEMLTHDAEEGSETAQFTGAITRNAGRLLELVDDLLLLARIGSGTKVLSMEPVDLTALLTVEIADAAAADESITITSDVPDGLRVIGDHDALARAIANVVSNAMKYSLPGGAVYVSAGSSRAGLEIRVRDNGIGIPHIELDAVFGQFFRASTARQSGRPGTGLGLAIVRSIMEQHGGTAGLTSEVGVGTEVVLTLPAD